MRWSAVWARGATVACFAVTALLAVGADLSHWAIPQPQPTATFGDGVVLDVTGTLANGTTFLDNRSLGTTLGNGSLVPGLERAVVGLHPGQAFQADLTPDEGYGRRDPRLVTDVPRTESQNATFTIGRARFTAMAGTPQIGQRLTDSPWDVVVVGDGDPVVLRYDAQVGSHARIYRYWPSQVVRADNASIVWENLLHAGDSFRLSGRNHTPGRLVRITSANATTFVLDSNPALAGQTLHVHGRLLAIRPGTGMRRLSGMAFAVGNADCASCHGGAGFVAVEAQAQATATTEGILVNLTLDNPWLHDVQDLRVTASSGNASAIAAAAHIKSEANQELSLHLPAGASSSGPQKPTTAASAPSAAQPPTPLPVQPQTAPASGPQVVHILVNATAHHVHRSGGKPDDLPYQVALDVPVGGHVGAATTAITPLASAFRSIGRWTGLVAMLALLAPSLQGLRRHLRRPRWLRVPNWLTTHVALSVLVALLSTVHAVTLMSSTSHGDWSWSVVLGAVALVGLGVMGVTGLLLAGWLGPRWIKARRVHFFLMAAVLVVALLHTVLLRGGLPWPGG